MVLLGITIAMAIIWAWYYWSVRYYDLASNVTELGQVGRAIQMAIRLALECVSQQRYTDAQFHIDTARYRHKQFTAVHPKTIYGSHLLLQEIVLIEQVMALATQKQFSAANEVVKHAAEKYVEYMVYVQLLEKEMNEYE